MAGCHSLRNQPRGEPIVHAFILENDKHATFGGGNYDFVVQDHLARCLQLAPLPVGGLLIKVLFPIGFPREGAATFDYLDKLEKMMIHKILVLLLLILLGSFVMAEEKPPNLFDFTGADAAKDWQSVNDGVMGGISEGKFRITDKKTMEFFGTLSLENNGGFASVRTKARKLGMEKGDTVVAKVRGDGREYMLNLYLNKPMIAFSYRAPVQTKKDEWIEVKIQLDKFEATSFGRVVKDAGTVKPEDVNSLGFMLSDKKAGPFRLEVESVRVEQGGK